MDRKHVGIALAATIVAVALVGLPALGFRLVRTAP